jgi:hypothetical protein
MQTDTPQVGDKVRVHFNLHRKTWSVSIKTIDGWRVRANWHSLAIRHASPICHSTRRILEKQQRAVVACIQGELTDIGIDSECLYGSNITFNPFRHNRFHLDKTSPTTSEWTGSNNVAFLPTAPNSPKGCGADCRIII